MNNFILLNNPKYNKFNQSSIEQNENDLIVPINPKFILMLIYLIIEWVVIVYIIGHITLKYHY